MAIEVPTWFKQRQAKAEPAGDNVYRLTGPNMREVVLGLRRSSDGKWQGFLRPTLDGADISVTSPRDNPESEAWQVAFEMYRQALIV
jgi:hypothetical protein